MKLGHPRIGTRAHRLLDHLRHRFDRRHAGIDPRRTGRPPRRAAYHALGRLRAQPHRGDPARRCQSHGRPATAEVRPRVSAGTREGAVWRENDKSTSSIRERKGAATQSPGPGRQTRAWPSSMHLASFGSRRHMRWFSAGEAGRSASAMASKGWAPPSPRRMEK